MSYQFNGKLNLFDGGMLKSIINDAIATTKAYTEDFIAKKCENDKLKHALNQNDKETMKLTNYSGKNSLF